MREAGRGDDHLALLLARVRRLYYVEAGQPPFQTLERVAEAILAESKDGREWLRPLPRSTACDLVNGKYRKAPDWLLIRTLVIVCHRIATKSDLDIAPQDELLREISRLWKAAKTAEDDALSVARTGDILSDPEEAVTPVGGDVLSATAEELSPPSPALVMRRTPEGWGRLSRRRLEEAEAGDAVAAYEISVLLACEALGPNEDPEDARYWRDMAAFWQRRAMGKVPKAAELLLDGMQPARAAYAIAVEYKKLEKRISKDFFEAATKADAAILGSRVAPATNGSSEELIVIAKVGDRVSGK